MRFELVIIFIACIRATLSQDQKYCDPKLCPSWGAPQKHIACPGTAINVCPPDAKEIPMTNEIKKIILDYHNLQRNDLAGGRVNGLPTARQMPVVEWDEELSYVAKFNVMQCKPGHDECRNTETYMYAGQNFVTSPNPKDAQEGILKGMGKWWEELKDCKASDIQKYGSSQSYIGHMTQMSQDRMKKVGCAASQYTASYGSMKYIELYLICNYSFTNIYEQQVYVAGPIASGCKTGPHRTFRNLCSENEVVDHVPVWG